ncbi:MAG: winged helix-turn-helix domain-containing protein [Bacteroidaceae bacterium]|jgi:hypothetical protein|nr:winged helix-turn-helix domain-containing protein [Bacteroidaceae bacterium]MBR4779170.1 winged helix-turn-helix domain-containing protein [Bacteroidaceae bacterium]
MLETKVGEFAGLIWNALNENAMNLKDLKKATKIKKNEELFLGLGWLLREGKLNATETEEDVVYSLK